MFKPLIRSQTRSLVRCPKRHARHHTTHSTQKPHSYDYTTHFNYNTLLQYIFSYLPIFFTTDNSHPYMNQKGDHPSRPTYSSLAQISKSFPFCKWWFYGVVVNATALHAEGHEFDSRQNLFSCFDIVFFFVKAETTTQCTCINK